eukprot:8582733-Pyramimonas_sp.AAC.1
MPLGKSSDSTVTCASECWERADSALLNQLPTVERKAKSGPSPNAGKSTQQVPSRHALDNH